MFLGAIWAQSLDGFIGDGVDMPWYLPEDLAHFKEVTLGHPVLMGRRTWESLPPRFRPLPGRENLVLSSSIPGPWSQGATVVRTLADAASHRPAPNQHGTTPGTVHGTWVIGGGQVYAATIDMVDRLEVTFIDANVGETLGERAVPAPQIPADFSIVAETDWMLSPTGRLRLPGREDSQLPLRYRFMSFERKDCA